MIKAVLIDIDNTILDFDAYVEWSIRTGMEHFGICKYEPYMLDVFHTENNKLWKQIEEGTLTIDELKKIRFNNVFAALGFSFDGVTFEKYFRDSLNESAILIDGAKEMIEDLSKDYILCTASNGPYNQQVHRMEISGLNRFISHHFISEKIGYSKPSENYFKRCMKVLNKSGSVCVDEVVMIGDSVTADINGGKAFGMKTVFFDKHKTGKTSVADYNVDSLLKIPSIIRSIV